MGFENPSSNKAESHVQAEKAVLGMLETVDSLEEALDSLTKLSGRGLPGEHVTARPPGTENIAHATTAAIRERMLYLKNQNEEGAEQALRTSGVTDSIQNRIKELN